MGQDYVVPIIWRDEDLLVINKPAGLLSLPDGYNPALPHIKGVLSPEYGPLWIVHRLDRQTSGVMMVARNAHAHRQLNIQFQEHQVRKIYHAVVLGFPQWEQKIVNLPLRVDGDRQHRTVIDNIKGATAATKMRLIERFDSCCLIEASPETGRRHQIRAHLAAIGLPIMGDELYGKSQQVRLNQANNSSGVNQRSTQLAMPRLALHAWSIELTHPGSLQLLLFRAPYPIDIINLLDQIKEPRS
jgi:RluA family pseudouridine synthase